MLDVPSYILGKKAGGGGESSDYDDLTNKPSINDVTLSGNKTTADLGITIPTKTSDLTNDGTNASYTSMLHYGLTNEENSGLYFGTGNDVRARKSISSSEYTDTSLEVQANKVTSISSSSTDTQYPSAKAVYDNSLDVYSTTEQRIGTWIDGKPLYQKCFTGTLTSSQTIATIQESDISSDLDKICYLGGIVDKRGTSGHPIPYWKGSTDYANAFITGVGKDILVECGSQHGFGDFVLTVKYTKTTD